MTDRASERTTRPLNPRRTGPAHWRTGLRRLALAATLCATTAAAWIAPARAEIVDWSEVSGWFVAVDTTFTPRSCFAAAEFDGETYFRIGVDASDATVYAVLANPHWASLRPGDTYGVELWFGDETPWGFAMHAGQFPDGSLFLISFTDDWLLLEEFAGETNVRVVYEGRDVANLDLSGSPEALNEVMECQRAMDEDARLANGVVPVPPPEPSTGPRPQALPIALR